MTTKRFLAALPLIAALAGCIPPAPEPTPAPTPAPAPPPVPAPTPAPPPPPPPSPSNWMDVPATPGDWFYRSEPSGGVASFGEPQTEAKLQLRCELASGTVAIIRTGAAAAGATMTIRTETADRALAASTVTGPLPTVVARLPARDPLLDAMAFSKGRFAVEVTGLQTLYVPAWPEVTRVIEDCR